MYDIETILEYVKEEDIKFIRLSFTDIYGRQKNVSVMPHELLDAYTNGVGINAHLIDGFTYAKELYLFPNLDTISILPWRPREGRVIRLLCDIKYPNGKPFECDTRRLLALAVEYAKKHNIEFKFGSSLDFYLFKADENGNSLNIPYDNAGYLDVAPDDKGENIRREICLMLEEMSILPIRSHHNEGPGQNRISFKLEDPTTAATNTNLLKSVVKMASYKNGLVGDFSPKPVANKPGNAYNISFDVNDNNLNYAIEGILRHIKEITAFLNIKEESYERFDTFSAPKSIYYSEDNKNELINITTKDGKIIRAELRSADPLTNPNLALALIIYAATDGILNKYELSNYSDKRENLPLSLVEAKDIAKKSKFIAKYLPKELLDSYLK